MRASVSILFKHAPMKIMPIAVSNFVEHVVVHGAHHGATDHVGDESDRAVQKMRGPPMRG